jgi:hypothetical protein
MGTIVTQNVTQKVNKAREYCLLYISAGYVALPSVRAARDYLPRPPAASTPGWVASHGVRPVH